MKNVLLFRLLSLVEEVPMNVNDHLPRHFSWVIQTVLGQCFSVLEFQICKILIDSYTITGGCARPETGFQLRKLADIGVTLLITLAEDQLPHDSINDLKELR